MTIKKDVIDNKLTIIPNEYDEILGIFLLDNGIDTSCIWDIINFDANYDGNSIINNQCIKDHFADYGIKMNLQEYIIYSANRIVKYFIPKCIFNLPMPDYMMDDGSISPEVCQFWTMRFSSGEIRKRVKMKAFI